MADELIFETSYVGYWIKVYPNRVEFKAGPGSQLVPINQIASVSTAMMGMMQITIETTGGKKYIPKEWYCVPIHIIRLAVELIDSGEIVNYIYDSKSEKMVEMN